MPVEVIDRDAVFSDDGRYRYILRRTLRRATATKTLGVYMVNPSTAGAVEDDPTIRRVYSFAGVLDCRHILVGNKFARKATDIKDLKGMPLALATGPDNDLYLREIARESDVVLFAWGPLAKLDKPLRNRWKDVTKLVLGMGKTPMCLGVAQDGHPRHPLMVASSTSIVPWEIPWFIGRDSATLHASEEPAHV